jgi:hypothetical protein
LRQENRVAVIPCAGFGLGCVGHGQGLRAAQGRDG